MSNRSTCEMPPGKQLQHITREVPFWTHVQEATQVYKCSTREMPPGKQLQHKWQCARQTFKAGKRKRVTACNPSPSNRSSQS
eukprot:1048446-Pelagomonas_calceolata.AAC.4